MTKTFISMALFVTALFLALLFSAGCSHEVSHSESDKPGWFGGHTSQETTVIQNSDGTVSTEHSSSTTK